MKREPLTTALVLLRDWQVQRLARTYQDLLNNPRYGPSCHFFINDIYAARDFSQRNDDLMRLRDTLQPLAPEALIRPLSMALELHALTEELDRRLLEVLVQQMGMTDKLTAPMYADAYRRCNNHAQRVQQIEQIVGLGTRVEALVDLPFSGAMLKLARGTADRRGQADVMSFLERGYKAFKQMRGAKDFLNTIRQRELAILDRIYASNPDPFDFGIGAR